MYLSVIIPAYNEEKRIEATLRAVHGYLREQAYDYEIVVVDDGSKDGTFEVAQRLEGELSCLRVVHYRDNRGKGWAVRTGMLEAHGEIRVFMDADNSTRIDTIATFLPYFTDGYDVVIGSRRAPGATIVVRQSFIRDMLGSTFRLLLRSILPLGVRDSQAGFKAFSKKATEMIFSKQTIFGWAFDVEILAIARTLDLQIKELPITWYNDNQSHVTISGMAHMLFEVFTIKRNIGAGLYSTYSKS